MDRDKLKLQLKTHSFFTNQLRNLIENLLIANAIKYHVIESRTKDLDSLLNKIERKKINTIDEVTDLSGLRVIVYYQDDIDLIEKIITENFKLDFENSIDKSKLYKSNEFGYLSVHYIISLNQQRDNLREWSNFKGLKAEIQVRTVLQHSWASIAHELSYKKEYEIPQKLERKLFRLAGLFELADEEFLNIREKHKDMFSQLKESEQNNEIINEKINIITLSYLFNNDNGNPIVEYICNAALEGGFSKSKYDEKDSFFSEINEISQILNIKTVKEFYNILEKNKKLYLKYFKKIISNNKKSSGKLDVWFGDKYFFTSLALILEFDNAQILDFESKARWNNELLKIITSSVRETKGI